MFSGKSDLSKVQSFRTTVQTSSWLSQLLGAIEQKSSGKQSPDQEVETLMTLCLSENVLLSLQATHLLVRLAEKELLPLAQVRTMLLSMLPNAEGHRFAVVVNGISDLLLIELRTQCRKGKYSCPYGLQHPEHPFIAVLNAKHGHGHEITAKIKEIFNHQDKDVQNAAAEFLRPVFLYALKNAHKIPSVKEIWLLLVTQSFKFQQMNQLFQDCLMWMSCQKASLVTNMLLCDALEVVMHKKKTEITAQVLLILAGSLSSQLKLGLCPRFSFSLINRILQMEQIAAIVPKGVLLMIFIDLLEDISSIYVEDLLKLVTLLVVKMNMKGFLIHHMLLDSLMLRSQDNLVSGAAKKDIEMLKEFIEQKKNIMRLEDVDYDYGKFANILDKTLGFYVDLEEPRWIGEFALFEKYFDDLTTPISSLKAIKIPAVVKFTSKVFRGMLLCHREEYFDVPDWAAVMKELMDILRENEDISIKFLQVFRLEMKRITDKALKLELLRGIVECAHFTVNVKLIVELIRAFIDETGSLSADILKLYLRLWQIDARTYQYLYDHLSQVRGKPDKELNMARAKAIKAICEKNPTQHGKDLVSHLSDVLNQSSSSSDDGEVICIVLDTIILLCESKTVSIVAIWKALGFIFRFEKRANVTQSLCKFFGDFPKYPATSPEYVNMAKEVYDKLWSIALNPEMKEVREFAFKAMTNFPLDSINVKQVPEQFRRNLKLPKSKLGPDVNPLDTLTYIPGECWLELLLNIDEKARDFAAEFVAEHIRTEIREYRGGVYNVPAGKGEPENLSSLPPKSIIRPIVQFVHQQAQLTSSDDFHLVLCVKVLAQDFPKPIPPVNWSCLHEIFHRCLEIRQHCVALAINQSAISGSAKRFLCNYLEGFEPKTPDDRQEMEAAFDRLPKLLSNVDHPLLMKFILRCLKFVNSNHSDNSVHDRIRKAIPSLSETDLAFLGTIFMESTSTTCSQKFIHDYERFFGHLEEKHLNFAMNFSMSTNIAVRRHMSCQWAGFYKQIKFLNSILKHISDLPEKFNGTNQWTDFEALRSKLRDTYGKFDVEDASVVNWCLQILADMQFAIMNEHEEDFYNYCSIFTDAIVHMSKYSVMEWIIVTYDRCETMDAFPQGLTSLLERNQWKDNAGQIYNFLLEFIQMPNLREDVSKSFKRAIVLSKDLPHFQEKTTWAKAMMIIRS
ncbi:focadhesin [Phlebotomus argentipes]|uniref:focadhesin n=1 Tax=Phlebotomus argentipes TaxID=94469 RepID=UPI002892F490|nr:focadhesin [Phlebotomus argentipes]